jgi:alpha-L-fucosidase
MRSRIRYRTIFELYTKSVGRNSKLLLNVPPTRAGLLHQRDVASLDGFRDLRSRFDQRLAARGTGDISLARPTTIDAVRLAEDIERGQVVSRYVVQGLTDRAWRQLSTGTTIGYAKIDTFAPVTVSRVRVAVLESSRVPSVRCALNTPVQTFHIWLLSHCRLRGF